LRIFFSLILLFITETSVWGQFTIKGTVLSKDDSLALPGVIVKEVNSRNSTISDINGQFHLNVRNSQIFLAFEFVGFRTQLISADSLNSMAKIVYLEIDNEPLEEIVIFAPNPPYLELGYFGRFSNQPFGFQGEYSTSADKFRCSVNYSSDMGSNSFISAKVGSYRNRKYKIDPCVSFYRRAQSSEHLSLIFVNNQLNVQSGVIKLGAGFDQLNKSAGASFLFGYRFYFSFFRFLNTYMSYMDTDLFWTKKGIGWDGKMYFDLYNKDYKNLSFAIGHQRVFDQSSLVININYKYYFLDRNHEK
jgi:hypothetical protein